MVNYTITVRAQRQGRIQTTRGRLIELGILAATAATALWYHFVDLLIR